MAVDQTEAMIAAIKAQLEKERAAEAAKKKREEEEEFLKNGGKKKEAETTKSQHKTLSKEELERIEAKRRRKREEALGIVREDEPETSEEDEKKKEVQNEGEGLKPDDKEKKKENGPAPKLSLNLGGIADDMQDGLGGIGGGVIAVLNFFLMGLAVQKAASATDEGTARMKLKASYSQRFMMMILWVIVAIVAPCFQFVAGIAPLLFPGTGLKFVGIFHKAN